MRCRCGRACGEGGLEAVTNRTHGSEPRAVHAIAAMGWPWFGYVAFQRSGSDIEMECEHMNIERSLRGALAGLLVGAVVLVGCGDDGDDDSTESTAATETTAATDSDGGSSGTDTPAGASGTATFSAGDLTIDGDITACEIPNETDLTMTVVGENAGFQVTSTGEGGAVAVAATGAAEFEGTGQASVSDSGDISVTGQGSELDDDAPVVDFTITGTIESC